MKHLTFSRPLLSQQKCFAASCPWCLQWAHRFSSHKYLFAFSMFFFFFILSLIRWMKVTLDVCLKRCIWSSVLPLRWSTFQDHQKGVSVSPPALTEPRRDYISSHHLSFVTVKAIIASLQNHNWLVLISWSQMWTPLLSLMALRLTHDGCGPWQMPATPSVASSRPLEPMAHWNCSCHQLWPSHRPTVYHEKGMRPLYEQETWS